jgi:hypothetical protein
MTMATNWVVMKITQRPSKYGDDIYEITFANTSGEIAHTYIDRDNRNFNRWRDIITGYDQDLGIVVNGLKIKRTGTHKKTGEPLVNADSLVKVVHVEDRMQDLLDQFVEVFNG